METFSTITLLFTEDLESGTVSFKFGNLVDEKTVTVTEEWYPIRDGANKVSIGEPTETAGEISAINFMKAFEIDYNVGGLFSMERTGNSLVLKSTSFGIDFGDFSGPESVEPDIVNLDVPSFNIVAVTFTTGSHACSNVTVNVQTTETASKVLSPVVIDPVTSNPITFVHQRGVGFILRVQKGAIIRTMTVNTPALLSVANIDLDIDDNPFGSSVEINVFGYGLTFQYSLDNETWQSSNVFSGLSGGDYTAYVKDQFGCTRSKNFTLTNFGINIPFFNLPTANSIRFANRVVFGDCANYKNDENTLSCEADVPVPYKEILQFQACDVITTQFKSNYQLNQVTIVGITEEIAIPVTKMTENMYLKDMRDAIKFELEDGRTGIYFTSGDIYDFDTEADIGDYALNGALPEWGVVGNYVRCEGVWYLIEEIVFVESRNADVLVVNGLNAFDYDIPTLVASFYNRFNYEVYEFTLDFVNWINQNIQVQLTAQDTSFDEITYLSEVINVQVRHRNTVEIRYKNKTNTSVFYATGIEHKMRIPVERIDGQNIDETETYKTDTNTILLSASVYQANVFELGPVTKQMMWKIIEALSHSTVKMDGVSYVRQNIEVEGALDETNLYMVKATMLKADSVYNSNGGAMEYDETGGEIPALIPTGNGYVKYQ